MEAFLPRSYICFEIFSSSPLRKSSDKHVEKFKNVYLPKYKNGTNFGNGMATVYDVGRYRTACASTRAFIRSVEYCIKHNKNINEININLFLV